LSWGENFGDLMRNFESTAWDVVVCPMCAEISSYRGSDIVLDFNGVLGTSDDDWINGLECLPNSTMIVAPLKTSYFIDHFG
jgi:hypothetical protein